RYAAKPGLDGSTGRERDGCGSRPEAPGLEPPLSEICCAVCYGGRGRAALKRHIRGLLLLPRTQGRPDPDSARAGDSCGGQDQPVRQGNREPARLDHAIAVVGEPDRTASL